MSLNCVSHGKFNFSGNFSDLMNESQPTIGNFLDSPQMQMQSEVQARKSG